MHRLEKTANVEEMREYAGEAGRGIRASSWGRLGGGWAGKA